MKKILLITSLLATTALISPIAQADNLTGDTTLSVPAPGPGANATYIVKFNITDGNYSTSQFNVLAGPMSFAFNSTWYKTGSLFFVRQGNPHYFFDSSSVQNGDNHTLVVQISNYVPTIYVDKQKITLEEKYGTSGYTAYENYAFIINQIENVDISKLSDKVLEIHNDIMDSI